MTWENDISRISYLMMAIVSKPELVVHCVKRFQENGEMLPAWAEALPVFLDEVGRVRGDGWTTRSQLYVVAETMMDMTDEHRQTIGRFLTQALEMTK